jgi:hypothetical protein
MTKPKPKSEHEPRGRPTDYRPEFARQAKGLCKLGATNVELADFFQVTIPTIWCWSVRYPEFSNAIRVGKGVSDERVVRSLFERASGYTYDAEEIHIIEGEVVRVPVRKHVPPDVGAGKYWTMNRLPGEWREQRGEENTPGTVILVGGFSGSVTVKADRDQVPDPAPEPVGGVRKVSDE